MNSIFVLKPILDLIYEDAKRDKEEIEALKKRITFLEGELKNRVQGVVMSEPVTAATAATVATVTTVAAATVASVSVSEPVHEIKSVEIDDSQYAAEASRPATSVPISLKNEVVQEGDTKTVQMVNNMSKKEYMKEYQKNYRKKQKEGKENKEIIMNV
jgi:hypothetical protein